MWDFLDVMDKNLLYKYADLLSGKSGRFNFFDNDIQKEEKEEQKKSKVYYLIWIVYRYALQCRTYEETIPYQNEETLKKYRLHSWIINEYIFLCNGEICFRKTEDIAIILEILYNRYDLWQQFDCVIRNTGGVRRKRCMEAKEKYQRMYSMMKSGEYDEDEDDMPFHF